MQWLTVKVMGRQLSFLTSALVVAVSLSLFAASDGSAAETTEPDYERLGDQLFDKREYRQALYAFTKAIALKPENPNLYISRGLTYELLHDYSKVIRDEGKAIELMPDAYLAYLNRGAAYIHLKKYPAATADFKRAIELRPDSPEPYFNLGIVLSNEHDIESAIGQFQKAASLYSRKGDQKSASQILERVENLRSRMRGKVN